MIVVALVAILAAIALPSYTQYVQRSHRANARGALLQASQWMERAATAQGRYPVNAEIPAGVLAVEGGRYTVVANSTTRATYTFTATPTVTQASDACGGFILNQAGTRTQTSTSVVSTPLSPQECWNR
ncbi:type IV pilin protein [Hydrogenophaga sp.]|uniref:type IV pilin protein n=1 Tax=Hydrogenophaga sp. TaxID=1904254 RepID=UPI00356B0F03